MARSAALSDTAFVVGIVAGESSGDALGAGLMLALQARHPNIRFIGIGGDAMLAAGLTSVRPITDFNVNGFSEPLRRLPDLLRIYKELAAKFKENSIHAFVGVDFNVFNLLLARGLKRAGFPTVHYVSPSVYAWRRGRIARLGRAVDLLLTLFPFEPPLYAGTSVTAVCVGHPMADAIEPLPPVAARERQQQALASFGLSKEATAVALLPGSRRSELQLMLPAFLGAAIRIAQAQPKIQFLLPCPRPELEPMVAQAIAEQAPDIAVTLVSSSARAALTACQVALVKSGTSTLEAMFLRRPMVVSYRVGKLTYRLVRQLLRTDYVALPNILAGRAVVPELLQDAATPEALANAVLEQLERHQFHGKALDKPASNADDLQEFERQHLALRRDANQSAARAVSEYLGWS